MNVPLSWLKDYVDIDLPLDELARVLTGAGLEVDEITLVGLPMPQSEQHEFKFKGLTWERDKFVVAQIDEVMPHPNADRLVLCRLNDGSQDLVVLTGAPNLYPYKGQGQLAKPLKVAYAREGAQLYDGHQPGQNITTLKRAKIRGVESFSMVCSEKELGISDDHDGVIILDDDATTGMPLVDYMGDAVFTISILPNMIRNACMIGIAREIAAQTGKVLKMPTRKLEVKGTPIDGAVSIQITDSELNPRFTLGLVRGVSAKPSPYWVQRRLRLAGMRAINSMVDATNYIMLETNHPMHAFDYDVLVKRAGGKTPTIITRSARQGEHLTTLDNIDRELDAFTILVTDTAGSLSLAGVMGGLESEITESTTNVLLEAATWNFINSRRTVAAQRLISEAGYRFARGIPSETIEDALSLCLDRMALWSGGAIAKGLVDNYPKKLKPNVVTFTPSDVRRLLGIDLSAVEISRLLERLEFKCKVEENILHVTAPIHRLDIGEDVIGIADVIEEVARLYGYDNIPATRLGDMLPPQKTNILQEGEDRIRNLCINLGLQEVITYRLTSPEREGRLPGVGNDYVRLQNPIAPERSVMRRSVLAGVLEVLEKNMRLRNRFELFEIGPIFLPQEGEILPAEPVRLGIVMSGVRLPLTWDQKESPNLDFYDLKGVLQGLFNGLHIPDIVFETAEHPAFHPGKCARVRSGSQELGIFGELYPLVKEKFDFGNPAVLAADLDASAILDAVPVRYDAAPVPIFPPVLEDLALVVDEVMPAQQVAEAIRAAGGKLVVDVRLFDIFRSEQIGMNKKSLAYGITYQATDKTLTDGEVTKIRQRIIRALDLELGAKLRG